MKLAAGGPACSVLGGEEGRQNVMQMLQVRVVRPTNVLPVQAQVLGLARMRFNLGVRHSAIVYS